MISWKNSFKRLNEEYELAKKKKQAVDNLYITGKISQFTRDSFNKDISATIVDIERQQKDLVEKMRSKTEELSCQITTLESLLANYEIQYVIGEIEEDAYQRDSLLLSAGINAAKNELEAIQNATMQLCPPIPTIQAPVPPELPVSTTVLETPVIESAPTDETTPAAFSPPIEAPVESNPIEAPIFEADHAPITETPIETQTFVAETPVFDEPVMESAFEESTIVVDEPVMESSLFEEVPVVFDEPVMESAPLEETLFETEVATIASADILADEPAIEIATTEPVFLADESMVEEPVTNYTAVDNATFEAVSISDAPLTEPTDVEMAPENIITDVPLQVFEVTKQAPIEQTLEKVMEQLNSPTVETLTVEELTHDSHPSIAPHQAPSDIITEAVSDGQIDESDEDTTE